MKKLFIFYGGPGRERNVSISSAHNVMQLLDEAGVAYESILVNEEGGWVYKGKIVSQNDGIALLISENALVFQVIHGTFGEDGSLCALLEENNISFVGSSSESMKLTIDKLKTERLLQSKDIPTTDSFLMEDFRNVEDCQITFPAFVKPKDEGSSISLFKVKNKKDLIEALEKSIPVYGAMLVQSFIVGRELTCGAVEIEGELRALLPTEIILTKGETFDYEAKYTVGGSKEITPAEIDEKTTEKIQELAVLVHTVCGCKDISRTDMILQEDGKIIVLEINTIPGMTKTSFIPSQLEASGFSVVEFIGGMVQKYS